MTSATLKPFRVVGLVVGLAAVLAGQAAAGPKPVSRSQPAKPPSQAAVCALGAQVLADQVAAGHRIFDGEQDSFGGFFKYTWPGFPKRLKAMAVRRPPGNLFQTCPELAQHLPEGGQMATPDQLAEVRGIRGYTGVYLTTVTTPLIDVENRVAVVHEFHRCAGLCGNGGAYVYRWKVGRWVKSEQVSAVLS